MEPGTDNDTTAAADASDTDTNGDAAEAEAGAVLEADLARLTGERDEMRALAQQLQADFENYKKQMRRRQTEHLERATEGLVEQLLPVLDSFELALGALTDAEDNVRKGVELVYAELLGVLEKAGVERIDAAGKPFDPTEHEAVLQEEGDGEPVVSDILRTGYRLKGRVLRPAMVKVAR
ncbi:MAG: nucleotide exchange factor GrpE [Acidimicrobiia bacterium]